MYLFINAETNEFVTELFHYNNNSVKASLTKKDKETVEVEILQYIDGDKGYSTHSLFSFIIKIFGCEEIDLEILQSAVNIMVKRINDTIESIKKESKSHNDIYILSIYDYITRHNEFCMGYKMHFKKVIYNQKTWPFTNSTHIPIIDYRLNL